MKNKEIRERTRKYTETLKRKKSNNIVVDNEETMLKIKLWLDDVREPSRNWVWVKTVEEAKVFLERGMVEAASLDHDLGEGQPTGYDLICWMEETGIWPDRWIKIHSMNPVGREKMQTVVDKCFKPAGPKGRSVVQKGMTKWARYHMEKIGDYSGLKILDQFERENEGKKIPIK